MVKVYFAEFFTVLFFTLTGYSQKSGNLMASLIFWFLGAISIVYMAIKCIKIGEQNALEKQINIYVSTHEDGDCNDE